MGFIGAKSTFWVFRSGQPVELYIMVNTQETNKKKKQKGTRWS